MNGPKAARCGVTLMELVVVMAVLVALAALVVPLVSNSLSNSQQTTTLASMAALRSAIIAYHQDMKGIQVGTASYPGTTGVPTTLKDLLVQPTDNSSPAVNVQPFNPNTQRGWRGPYLLQASGAITTTLDSSFLPTTGFPFPFPYGNPGSATTTPAIPGDPAFLDGWGNPIVLQWPQPTDTPPAAFQSQAAMYPMMTPQALYVRLVSAGPLNESTGKMASQLETVAIGTSATVLMPTTANRGNDLVMFIFVQDQYPSP